MRWRSGLNPSGPHTVSCSWAADSWGNITRVYSHPVWLMNGIFTAVDPVSVKHRLAIANYLINLKIYEVADYGGGFGELALAINKLSPITKISIIEPYPTKLGFDRVKRFATITIKPDIEPYYDAIVAQDVLEHVEDPINLAHRIGSSVKMDGIVVFANCFSPVIKCHLPATFHLRHTFTFVMKAMGFKYLGRVPGARHAMIYQRSGTLNLSDARSAEMLSRFIGPFLNFCIYPFELIKKMFSS
jgi:2-polyprenyl-3-methyl-5-hydroxy-6-metoxy-1,4-benzoquinol methylase